MKVSIFSLLLFFTLLWHFSEAQDIQNIEKLFKNPPADCWPHTRWWWPGNPVSKTEITWQLEQMQSHGIRGVEQITMDPVYEKGNIPYDSEEYYEMIKHTVSEAKRLGMEISFNFGGPGWIIGGDWVPKEDKAKDMVPTSVIVTGPGVFDEELPKKLTKTKRSWEIYEPELSGNETLLAVVAGKITEDVIDPNTLTVITTKVTDRKLNWKVPEGDWKIMAFWLKTNNHANAVDHFSKEAMQRYCTYLGGRYRDAVGDEFGKTVDSFFADSFELSNLAGGIYWSTGLLEKFREKYGYDLTPFLPCIWWQVGEISPKIRYDVNEFLHTTGMNAFFNSFLSWCRENQVKGRIQTYGFTTDNIEAAGKTDIPEMEISAGEKDAAEWFDTRIGPKKYVASGAHIYGRDVISTEAYTFIHWERYRATLEELKIASDVYLRNGATKFYNHGFTYSPEREVTPARSIPYAAFIHPKNVWWKYYPKLAEYIARCSFLLRQGDFAPDIAVYSPLANQWTLNVLNPRKWTREFDWGELGNLLIANGYDFDLLNDDALQNLAKIENGNIKIRNMEYKILLLPNIQAIPLKSIQFIEKYVLSGGTVIALERTPEYSTGWENFAGNDMEVQKLAAELFNSPKGNDDTAFKSLGNGQTYQIKQVLDRTIWWDKRSSTFDPFLNTIRNHISPDFSIDFAQEGIRRNEGLTFLHRKLNDTDIYFVTNIQDETSTVPVTFRTDNNNIRRWNPYNGEISEVLNFIPQNEGITLPLELAPYESVFFVFSPGEPPFYVSGTSLNNINSIDNNKLSGSTFNNGNFYIEINSKGKKTIKTVQINDIPAPLHIDGEWKLTLEGKDFPRKTENISSLSSWTKDEKTKHFSGTGEYEITFEVPSSWIDKHLNLILDLGRVCNVAEVFINNKNAGTVWMQGQKVDITRWVKPGRNKMVVQVTNTLINQISAMQNISPVPEELVPRFGTALSPNPEVLPREFGFGPLPASGLLGPVKIIPLKNIIVSF